MKKPSLSYVSYGIYEIHIVYVCMDISEFSKGGNYEQFNAKLNKCNTQRSWSLGSQTWKVWTQSWSGSSWLPASHQVQTSDVRCLVIPCLTINTRQRPTSPRTTDTGATTSRAWATSSTGRPPTSRPLMGWGWTSCARWWLWRQRKN